MAQTSNDWEEGALSGLKDIMWNWNSEETLVSNLQATNWTQQDVFILSRT